MSDKAVMERIRGVIELCGSRRRAAWRLGISVAYLGELVRGTRNPGPKVLAALGLHKETIYKEDSGNGPGA